MATKDPSKDIDAVKNMSGGGHLGGTHIGQQPDAKTASTNETKGRKERPNNGQED
jgi:hypothetical protein